MVHSFHINRSLSFLHSTQEILNMGVVLSISHPTLVYLFEHFYSFNFINF